MKNDIKPRPSSPVLRARFMGCASVIASFDRVDGAICARDLFLEPVPVSVTMQARLATVWLERSNDGEPSRRRRKEAGETPFFDWHCPVLGPRPQTGGKD
jgi:hypothetical protein